MLVLEEMGVEKSWDGSGFFSVFTDFRFFLRGHS